MCEVGPGLEDLGSWSWARVPGFEDLISWTFAEGFSFQIEKLKEVAELWCQQRAKMGRTPNPKKKVKMSQTVQLTRRDAHISHNSLSFLSALCEEVSHLFRTR